LCSTLLYVIVEEGGVLLWAIVGTRSAFSQFSFSSLLCPNPTEKFRLTQPKRSLKFKVRKNPKNLARWPTAH